MFICQYCGREGKNTNSHKNHERQCPQNPTRVYRNGMTGKRAWNKGLKKDTDDRVKKNADGVKKHYRQTDERYGACSPSFLGSKAHRAASSRGGGYKPNAGRSKKYRVLDSFGKVVVLQSSYELVCSELLNKLAIRWIRPKHLKYGNKKYFPDFYLVDADIYLDPKNDYLAQKDIEKICAVMQENDVQVYVLLENDLTEEKIISLLPD